MNNNKMANLKINKHDQNNLSKIIIDNLDLEEY